MEFGAFTGCRSDSSRGSAVITATVDNPACDAITLHVTVEETQIPAVGDISISVAADSENNPISFSTQRSYIESVSMVEQATSGTARVSGTDSFTYFATNVIGDSNIGTATIEVTPFNNADLSALSLSEGTLSPSFDPNTLAYAAQVAPGTQAVTVTPTAEDSASTIDVNGETVDLGSVSPQVMLGQCGTDTAIEVDVTAQDNTTTNTYTITVARIGEISVVFDLGESGEPFDEQLVKCATTATEPEQPSLPGQVFTGWYLTDGSSG